MKQRKIEVLNFMKVHSSYVNNLFPVLESTFIPKFNQCLIRQNMILEHLYIN